MTTIPRDQWYVAAYSTEIEQELFSRTICGEPILFWRTRSGAVTAVPDRCVHRRFPLSQAPLRLVEDQVVCGYHGFTYGADGKCVSVPAQIPRAPYLDSPDYTTVRGMEPLKARYSLLVDNLLDLSHETYLHGGTSALLRWRKPRSRLRSTTRLASFTSPVIWLTPNAPRSTPSQLA